MNNRHRINVTFDEEDFLLIKNIADKNKISTSEVVRNFTLQGLNGEIGAKNIDLISRILREQLKAQFDIEFNHIASLISKACIASAQSTFLNAEVIDRFVPENRRMDIRAAYDAAYVKAINYTKSKIHLDE